MTGGLPGERGTTVTGGLPGERGTTVTGGLPGERGTTVPLIVLLVLLAGTVGTAVTAAAAAFLAQRDLAGICDGAAVAAAAAATRPAGNGGLGLDPARIGAELRRYRAEAAPADPSLVLAAGTDGETVTVRCHRRVRIPFGAVLGAPDGLDRTALARARPILRPAARPPPRAREPRRRGPFPRPARQST